MCIRDRFYSYFCFSDFSHHSKYRSHTVVSFFHFSMCGNSLSIIPSRNITFIRLSDSIIELWMKCPLRASNYKRLSGSFCLLLHCTIWPILIGAPTIDIWSLLNSNFHLMSAPIFRSLKEISPTVPNVYRTLTWFADSSTAVWLIRDSYSVKQIFAAIFF